MTSFSKSQSETVSETVIERPTHARARLFGRTLSLEAEILLCCANARRDSLRTARCARLVEEDVDWESLIALAGRHSLVPLLYWQLRHLEHNTVPTEHLTSLRNRFQMNAGRNLFLTQELLEITRLLKTVGIGSIPYKGPALAAFAYGNLALRRFGDLDIIIRKHDIGAATSLLLAEGYVLHFDLTEAQQAAVLRTQHSLAFLNDEKMIVLELHWDVAGKRFSAQYDADAVGQRLQTVAVGGGTLDTLSAEDTLLALCVHGSKHLWERLAWVCDIAELIRSHEEIDWASVLRMARSSGSWRMVALGLLLATEMFDAPLPAAVRQEVDAAVIRKLAAQIAGSFFTVQGSRPALFESLSFNFRVREHLSDKLGYCGFIFSPTDADLASVSLPASLQFLYYLLRPIRLADKTIRRIVTEHPANGERM